MKSSVLTIDNFPSDHWRSWHRPESPDQILSPGTNVTRSHQFWGLWNTSGLSLVNFYPLTFESLHALRVFTIMTHLHPSSLSHTGVMMQYWLAKIIPHACHNMFYKLVKLSWLNAMRWTPRQKSVTLTKAFVITLVTTSPGFKWFVLSSLTTDDDGRQQVVAVCL